MANKILNKRFYIKILKLILAKAIFLKELVNMAKSANIYIQKYCLLKTLKNI